MEIIEINSNTINTFSRNNLFILSVQLVHNNTYAGSNFTSMDSMITLPPDIIKSQSVRIIHSYFFMNNITSVLFRSSLNLSSGVISASVGGQRLTNLNAPVNITFSRVS